MLAIIIILLKANFKLWHPRDAVKAVWLAKTGNEHQLELRVLFCHVYSLPFISGVQAIFV